MERPIPINDNLPSLLGADEKPAYELTTIASDSPLVILCDHASNQMPRCLGNLGLKAECFQQHIAYDIGAADVARRLAELFHCSLMVSGYSRLVIDLNRHPGDGSSIPELSDQVEIPANRHLSSKQIVQRENSLFWPYHNRVAEHLLEMVNRNIEPVIISIHSFTPEYRGYQRPWEIGVLWDQDRRLSDPLIRSLGQEQDLCIGDNQPYHARNPLGYTMDVHCERNGHHHVLLEIRQDLINDPVGVERWSSLIHRHLDRVLLSLGLT